MKILTASLGALLVLLAAPDGWAQPIEEMSFNFTTVSGIPLRDTGATGLEPGAYDLVFDRATAAPGDPVQAHLEPAGRAPIDRVVTFDGCAGGAKTGTAGYDDGKLKLAYNFGAQSRTRVSARPDGGVAVRVWARGSRTCSLSLVIPPAQMGQGSAPTTSAGPGGPGGLVNPLHPQCTPPPLPLPGGSPQPAPLGPSLSSTPVSPPDGGCELTGYPSPAEIGRAPEPALRSALTELRRAIDALRRVPEDDARAIDSARAAIRRSLAAVARASRRGDRSELASRCESNRYSCEKACGGRQCCCCTATYASCLLEP